MAYQRGLEVAALGKVCSQAAVEKMVVVNQVVVCIVVDKFLIYLNKKVLHCIVLVLYSWSQSSFCSS